MLAHRGQPLEVEGPLDDRAGRRAEPGHQSGGRLAGATMAARRRLQVRGGERGGVVGTQQLPGHPGAERDIEQPLVDQALLHLDRTSPRPQRLREDPGRRTASTDGTGVRLVDERLPRGDDPRRVRAQRAHVHEAHPAGVLAQPLQGGRERLVALWQQRHQHRLVAGESLHEVRRCPAHQVLDPAVEQDLVAEAAQRPHHVAHCTHGCCPLRPHSPPVATTDQNARIGAGRKAVRQYLQCSATYVTHVAREEVVRLAAVRSRVLP